MPGQPFNMTTHFLGISLVHAHPALSTLAPRELEALIRAALTGAGATDVEVAVISEIGTARLLVEVGSTNRESVDAGLSAIVAVPGLTTVASAVSLNEQVIRSVPPREPRARKGTTAPAKKVAAKKAAPRKRT